MLDDDPSIRKAFSDVLRREGYDVLVAGTAADAVAQVDAVAGAVDVLVIDIGLPDADGAEVPARIARTFGNKPTLFITGWADDFVFLNDVPGHWRIVQKPILIEDLVLNIRSLLSWRAT